MITTKPYRPSVPTELRTIFDDEALSLLGVTDAVEDEQAERDYRAWLESGAAGSMQWMHRHAGLKYHPSRLLANCRSILFCGINYYNESQPAPPASGRVARYAWGRDYHRLLGGRLRRIARRLAEHYPTEQFRNFSDATPLEERYYAERAGIGFTGRNTLLINSQYGSWFLVGEILSTRHFAPSNPQRGVQGACPSGCRRCLDVCPTGALTSPYHIDASRCISYLTIEHKGSIPEELRSKMGNWLFGCDLCQEVCPLNIRAQVTDVSDFLQIKAGEHLALRELLELKDHAAVLKRFAGSPLMRAGRRGLVRNACIVAANIGATELLPQIGRLADDSDPIVAEHARWSRQKLLDYKLPDSRG